MHRREREPVVETVPPPMRTGYRRPSLPRGLLLRGCIACAVGALIVFAPATSQSAPRRPNIVIILADDMGFADMGAFGSEIRTPNLDSLAAGGVRFTSFYTHASCSPTRSVLLSGVDTHRNGLGNMDEWTAPNQRGVPGYEGHLNHQVVTLPQLLQESGYHTYMVGKWHLGKAPTQIPAARGFERDFSLLDGAGSYWDMTNFTAASPQSVFTENGRYLSKLPKHYYATKTYTDKLIEFIDENRADGKPFFAYVAHQAPHDPYHRAAGLLPSRVARGGPDSCRGNGTTLRNPTDRCVSSAPTPSIATRPTTTSDLRRAFTMQLVARVKRALHLRASAGGHGISDACG